MANKSIIKQQTLPNLTNGGDDNWDGFRDFQGDFGMRFRELSFCLIERVITLFIDEIKDDVNFQKKTILRASHDLYALCYKNLPSPLQISFYTFRTINF